MQTLLINIISRIAAVIGVKSVAKQLITQALNSQALRDLVNNTETALDNEALDFVIGIVDKYFDIAWDTVYSKPCGDTDITAELFESALLEQIKSNE